MRLLFVNALRPESSDALYSHAVSMLKDRGIHMNMVRPPMSPSIDLNRYDSLISNATIGGRTRWRLPAWGGRGWSRPQTLGFIAQSGIPTMRWAKARSVRDVHHLFESWGVDHLILKRTGGGHGDNVVVFTPEATNSIQWQPQRDVFCSEVNPDDGDVYKVEVLGGEVLIAWRSSAPPIREFVRGPLHRGLKGAFGERALWEPSDELITQMRAFSHVLTDAGFGHVSLDLMRAPNGELVAIEMNQAWVATWWTSQFDHMRERFAEAVYRLLSGPASSWRRPLVDRFIGVGRFVRDRLR